MTETRKPITTARKVGYVITALVLGLVVAPLFIFGVYTIVTSLMNL